MDTPTIRSAINQFIQNLSTEIKPEQVVIVGSRATTTFGADSDIDCLIVSTAFTSMTEDERLRLLYRASRFIEPEIHPWGVTPEEFAIADKQSFVGAARESGLSYPLLS